MEFVTIHDLSRELNLPARVVRYRLINLIADSQMKEGYDFRRDEFKDDQHFVFKVNPLSFMRATGLKPEQKLPFDNNLVTPVTKVVNEPAPVVNQPVTQVQPVVTDTIPLVTKSVTSAPIKSEPSIEREMIDLLKEQLKVKDGQLQEQGEQMKDLNDLNVRLTGTMLQQNQKIENLLRLTGGRDTASDTVSNTVNQNADVVTKPGNQSSNDGCQEGMADAA